MENDTTWKKYMHRSKESINQQRRLLSQMYVEWKENKCFSNSSTPTQFRQIPQLHIMLNVHAIHAFIRIALHVIIIGTTIYGYVHNNNACHTNKLCSHERMPELATIWECCHSQDICKHAADAYACRLSPESWWHNNICPLFYGSTTIWCCWVADGGEWCVDMFQARAKGINRTAASPDTMHICSNQNIICRTTGSTIVPFRLGSPNIVSPPHTHTHTHTQLLPLFLCPSTVIFSVASRYPFSPQPPEA